MFFLKYYLNFARTGGCHRPRYAGHLRAKSSRRGIICLVRHL